MASTIRKILGKNIYETLFKYYTLLSIGRAKAEIVKNSGRFNHKSAVDFLFSKNGKAIIPMQHYNELIQLAQVIENKKPKTILEIGTARGGTLFLASQLADDDALIISIDLPDGMYGGGYPKWKIPYYKSFKKEKQTILLIQGDSHSKDIYNELVSILGERKLDYLFIDGDHTFEGVKEDFDTYSKFIDKAGIIAFHDIVKDRSIEPNHFVHEYWESIKNNYNYVEFINDPQQSKLGIGLIKL
jgi:predicted O-methyltransferase YrrM